MSSSPDFSPGTVSKILWHFTGGPTWNKKGGRKNKAPKPAAQAYQNLKNILETRELRLGSAKEEWSAAWPRKVVSLHFGTVEEKLDVQLKSITPSAPVCCLADIPVSHLGYHAYRYGKFAIGFHRKSAVRHGFNPVFYSPEQTDVVRSIYNGFSQFKAFDASNTHSSEQGKDVEAARASLRKFAAFIKTFSDDEFGTIYCEREWRALKQFNFKHDDVAMIVVPKKIGKSKFFTDFTEAYASTIKLPRSVPVVPWEDLVKH